MAGDSMDPGGAVQSTAALAARLGLSRWAVSRALNGRGGVSRETVNRVRNALAEYRFEPDPLARGLRGAPTGLVGVCAPGDGNGWRTGAAIAGLERRLRQGGWRVWLELGGGPDREDDAVRRFLALRVEAVVLIRPQSPDGSRTYTPLLRPDAPPCLLIDPVMSAGLPTARCDEVQAAELTIGHLHGLGHRKFALLGMDPGSARRQALQTAGEVKGVSWRADVRAFEAGDLPEPRPQSPMALGAALAREMMRRRCAATAIIAADDELAVGAMHALRELGRTAPRDYSIVGHGNRELAEYIPPGLTSIDPQFGRLVERAAELLCDQMRLPGRVETGGMTINPLLVRRGSTAMPPTA